MEKRKINILIPIFVILVLIYALRSLLGPAVRTEALGSSYLEDAISTKGLMIKYEDVVNPGKVGALEPLVQEEARVASGQAVAAVYNEQVDTNIKNKLEQVNKKIALIEKNQADLVYFSGDATRLEQKISEKTDLLVQQSLAGDMVSAGETQLVIQALCNKKAEMLGKGSAGNMLDELQKQKAELEAQAGTAGTYLTAPASGVFSTEIDGLESVITPDNMTTLTPDEVTDLMKQETKKDEENTSFKIIGNFSYYVAVNLPVDQISTLRKGHTVSLRFYDLSGDLVPATVVHISQEKNGEKTVLVECDRHLDTLLKRRTVNLDFVQKRYDGYRVSVKSLQTKDDKTGVYVIREDVMRFIPVEILHNSQDVAIVDSADAQNPLRLYDEVVVKADSYEEGKRLR